jgi:hypothetical protein
VKATVPGLADVNYAYDANGRLRAIQRDAIRFAHVRVGWPPVDFSRCAEPRRPHPRTTPWASQGRPTPASRTLSPSDTTRNGNLSSLTPLGPRSINLATTTRRRGEALTPPAVVSPPASPMGAGPLPLRIRSGRGPHGCVVPDNTFVVAKRRVGRLDTFDDEGRLSRCTTPQMLGSSFP